MKAEPGVLLALKSINGETSGKVKARDKVIAEFAGMRSVVTLPAHEWKLEWQLPSRGLPLIIALEKSKALFELAKMCIPGRGSLRTIECFPGTETVATRRIHAFHNISFERYADLMQDEVDAGWLDFCGPLTKGILKALPQFWLGVRKKLIITVNRGRVHGLSRDDEICRELQKRLRRAVVTDCFPYQSDRSPMSQICLTKK